MAKILTPVNTMLEHYLSLKYSAADFPRLLDRIDITGAATNSSTQATGVTALVGGMNLSSGTKKLFVTVDSVTDIATDMLVTLKDGATTIATATVLAHSGIDAIFPMVAVAAFTATPVLTVTTATGTAGVVFSVMLIDDAAWMDMGQNFSESINFQDGVLGVPVARGWDATAFQKRTRSGNQFSLRQLYCSQFEGVANLKGKTIVIKDEVRVDGSATIKETSFYVACSVTGVGLSIGAGGQEQADTVDAGGYYKRGYTWTQDATSQTAMV